VVEVGAAGIGSKIQPARMPQQEATNGE
jgi:hypothetical protein